MTKAVKVKFYETHEDGVAVYTKKSYDYLCRFKVEVGTPVVVATVYNLALAKIVAIDVESDKATQHVIGVVNTNPEA